MAKKEINIIGCDGSEYVLLPACAYNGNRFPVLKKEYPPMFRVDEVSPEMENTITDVPRLNVDGSGEIEVTSGDLSVPCIGIFLPKQKKGIFIYTFQQIQNENIGISYKNGKVTLTWPACRKKIYRWPHMIKNTEKWEDREGEIPYKFLEFECNDIHKFYRLYFENRKCMGLDAARPFALPKEKQKEVLIGKYNRENWFSEKQFYGTASNNQYTKCWLQPGWVGGGMLSYALLCIGNEEEKKRAKKTLDYILTLQHESGLFWGGIGPEGVFNVDSYGVEGLENWSSVRKNCDMLYFLIKHFEKLDYVSPLYEEAAVRLAEMLRKIWCENHQMGYFVDIRNGKMIAGNSAAGALAAAALASAAKWFQKKDWMEDACQIGEWLYEAFTCKGISTGGPTEILQCPDSESSFAILESFVMLYQYTKDDKWLKASQDAAHQCSSWVVAYNYQFPRNSEFFRLGIKTVGAVFANVQNKHAAPGICTLSGNSLRKLYYWTGDPLYLDLYIDITETMSQYISTEERPIYSWNVPKDATANNQNDIEVPSVALAEGYVCERVNMSDWETPHCVGGVFNASSVWCEINSLLVMAEDCNIGAD